MFLQSLMLSVIASILTLFYHPPREVLCFGVVIIPHGGYTSSFFIIITNTWDYYKVFLGRQECMGISEGIYNFQFFSRRSPPPPSPLAPDLPTGRPAPAGVRGGAPPPLRHGSRRPRPRPAQAIHIIPPYTSRRGVAPPGLHGKVSRLRGEEVWGPLGFLGRGRRRGGAGFF